MNKPKIPGGYIAIYRKIMDNPMYFAEPFTRMAAWIDLLLLANHKKGYIYVRGNQITVERGQVGMSEQSFAKRWQWSRGKVRRFLNELEKDKQIVQQKSRLKSLISIVKYDLYQTDGTTDGQQTDTNKKVNKEKKEKKYNMQKKDFLHKSDIEKEFEGFWRYYDKKRNKAKCLKKYNKLSKADREAIKKHLPKYLQSTPDKQFRKDPLTYLNNRGWEDEIITKKSKEEIEQEAVRKSLRERYGRLSVNPDP